MKEGRVVGQGQGVGCCPVPKSSRQRRSTRLLCCPADPDDAGGQENNFFCASWRRSRERSRPARQSLMQGAWILDRLSAPIMKPAFGDRRLPHDPCRSDARVTQAHKEQGLIALGNYGDATNSPAPCLPSTTRPHRLRMGSASEVPAPACGFLRVYAFCPKPTHSCKIRHQDLVMSACVSRSTTSRLPRVLTSSLQMPGYPFADAASLRSNPSCRAGTSSHHLNRACHISK